MEDLEILFTLATIFFHLAVRYGVSLGGYSGFHKPPMFGDYEAQRHWMEITINLPLDEWYRNSTRNDLQYWGLDYPPLTAYGSWICGQIGRLWEKEFMELGTSRGYETPTSKLFMRLTVLFFDVLILFPSVLAFVQIAQRFQLIPKKASSLCFFMILLQPALILIDHGHFQYNGISLGFTVAAITLIWTDHNLWGSFFFCLSLNYKQMSLYHAPPFFFYLLSKHLIRDKNFLNIIKIGCVVILTFLICWAPFLYHGQETTLQVLTRLFPFNRGLYEDKVANFWCATSPIIKWKNYFSVSQMATMSLFLTGLSLIPSSIFLLLYPTKLQFLLSLISSGLSFFLFSFQVHEKSILLPLMPATLCILIYREFASWFILIGTFSMFPLLYKDGVTIPYIALMTLFLCFSYYSIRKVGFKLVIWMSLLGTVLIHLGELFIPPPPNLQDLWILIYAVYSFFHFLFFYFYVLRKQYQRGLEEKVKEHRD